MARHVYYFHPSPWAHLLENLSPAYRLVPLDAVNGQRCLDFPAVIIVNNDHAWLEHLEEILPGELNWYAISCCAGGSASEVELTDRIFALLPQDVTRPMLERTLQRAFESLEWLGQREHFRRELDHAASDLATLNHIGVSLSTERNTDALLGLILSKSRHITCCDAGSVYLVEPGPEGGTRLVFKLTQSDSHSASFQEYTLPIDETSAAGYAAATQSILNLEDAYHIDHLPFRLNKDFDRAFNYRTKSMLVVPMQNQQMEVIGVLQLINAKRRRDMMLLSEEDVGAAVIPFSERDQQMAVSLASQAAVALENSLLYRDIQRLFEGFVKASITAIESRDPSTCGHSERVAKLTLGLAEAVGRSDSGSYAGVRFSPRDLQELRYAALLHDFGKVGVREHILVKAKKLYTPQLEDIQKRFLLAMQSVELEASRKKLKIALSSPGDLEATFLAIDTEQQQRMRRLQDMLAGVVRCNEPGLMAPENHKLLAEAAEASCPGQAGSEPLLSALELRLLSIARGTLDAEERAQIESHVLHSYRFLQQIPWTRDLKSIPEIAVAHHEKLNGSGYPYHLKGAEIPVQARMMTIADIFDALTASDRPYKYAVPTERALGIIEQEVKGQMLDPDLFNVFVRAKVYELTAKR